MSGPYLTVILTTPSGETVVDDVVRVRFEAPDGSRGVLPRHEPARCVVRADPLELEQRPRGGEPRLRFVATEGGMLWITPTEIRLVTPWARLADTLAELRLHLEQRARFRRDVEVQTRAVAHRHEVAMRRALAGLRRRLER